jgi:predicted N-acetyltransferase YhbS
VNSIRPFRNTDAPAISRLWTEHNRELRGDGTISINTLEIAILGRHFFSPDNLLVAVDGNEAIGFVHWMMVPQQHDVAVVAAISVQNRNDRDPIAVALLAASIERARAAGATRMLMGQAPEYWTGYAGIGGSGMCGGIAEGDRAVRRWAEEAGFLPFRRLVSYLLNVATYRPAYDRHLIAMRRSASVDRRRDVTDQPFRIAAAMSHLELHRFVASSRDGQTLAEADVLIADPEMLVVSGGTALLSRWDSAGEGTEAAAAARYVLSSAISELAAERISRIHATIESDRVADSEILRSVGFDVDSLGTIYSRSTRPI